MSNNMQFCPGWAAVGISGLQGGAQAGVRDGDHHPFELIETKIVELW
jgi:hypothetical protein